MKKILEAMIVRECDRALSILKRKANIMEAPLDPTMPSPDDMENALKGDTAPDDLFGNPSPQSDETGTAGAITGGNDAIDGTDPSSQTDPALDPTDAGTNPDDPSKDSTETPEESEDPVDATFKELENLSKQTDDVTKIVKMIKAKVQDTLTDETELQTLLTKINDEGSPLIKRALKRPELSFLQDEIINTVGEARNMKIKESELKKLVKVIAEKKISSLKENADYSAVRRINHMAAEAAMNFEEKIVSQLKILHPDQMSPELQGAYTNIMGEMQAKVCAAVADAVNLLGKFPREQKDQ